MYNVKKGGIQWSVTKKSAICAPCVCMDVILTMTACSVTTGVLYPPMIAAVDLFTTHCGESPPLVQLLRKPTQKHLNYNYIC